MEGPNTLYLKVAQKCIQIIRNLTIPNVVQFAIKRINFPDPIFLQLKGSISVLHSYYQPEPM